jgi:hypothetical protein
MAIKQISAPPAAIAVGSTPFGNGTNNLSYLPIGLSAQVLKVNSTATSPEWGYQPGKVLLASYSGSANVVLTNIPQYYRELRVVISSGGLMSNTRLISFTASNGGTITEGASAHYAINASATVGTANGTGTTGGSLVHPGSGVMAFDGGAVNTVEIVMPEYSGSTFGGSSITTDKVIYHVMMTPPGGATNSYGMGCAVTLYDVSAANVGITGFTIDLNAISSRVWVYAS